MAFKGIDFSKLGSLTPEEIAADEAARAERLRVEDNNRRDAWSKTTVEMTLADDAEVRHGRSGEVTVHLRAKDSNGEDVKATFWVPDHVSHEARSNLVSRLNEGASIEADGYWKSREWRDQEGNRNESREFYAQRLRQVENLKGAERNGLLEQAASLSGGSARKPSELSRGRSGNDLVAMAEMSQVRRHSGR